MGNWLVTILALVLLLAILDGARRAFLKHRASMLVSRKVSRNLSRALQGDEGLRDGDGENEHKEDREDRESRGEDDDMDILSVFRRNKKSSEENEDYFDPEEEARRAQIARELPGPVRVVQRRALEDALQVNRQVQENFMSARRPLAGSNPLRGESKDGQSKEGQMEDQWNGPEQASLNLEEQVPTLMDSVADEAAAEEARREPELNESESLQALNETPEEPEQEFAAEPRAEAPRPEKRAQVKQTREDRNREAYGRGQQPREQRPREQQPREKSPVEEVLVINVMAPEGDYIEGNDLLRVMVAAGMRFGEMNIFHYHEGGAADGPVVFSLANMVVPGVFDLAQMEEFATPGVSLFLALPIEGSALKAFEQLLATSRQIAELLGGELKDENRSVFTGQTAEHYRQRVMEYQRRKALAMAQA